MRSNIIVIGPIKSGKSSICKKLAEKLKKSHIDMDEQRSILYPQMGYSDKAADAEYDSKGIEGWYMYQKPFEINAVKTILLSSDNAVIEFGGGQSVYQDEHRAQEFIKLMSKEQYVFLLLPCSDPQKSLEILDKRIGDEDAEKMLNRIFIHSFTNKQAAKFTVFTEGKTTEETIDEIITLFNNAN